MESGQRELALVAELKAAEAAGLEGETLSSPCVPTAFVAMTLSLRAVRPCSRRRRRCRAWRAARRGRQGWPAGPGSEAVGEGHRLAAVLPLPSFSFVLLLFPEHCLRICTLRSSPCGRFPQAVPYLAVRLAGGPAVWRTRSPGGARVGRLRRRLSGKCWAVREDT